MFRSLLGGGGGWWGGGGGGAELQDGVQIVSPKRLKRKESRSGIEPLALYLQD